MLSPRGESADDTEGKRAILAISRGSQIARIGVKSRIKMEALPATEFADFSKNAIFTVQ